MIKCVIYRQCCEVNLVRIAICDDDKVCRARVLDIAADYAEERRDTEIIVEDYSSPAALLNAVQSGIIHDIYILETLMPDMNGIELGKALKSKNPESQIIYLTASAEFALDSYKVRAFDYILKPIEKNTFYAVMDEVTSASRIKQDKVLIVKTKENSARINFGSILYAELSKRAVIYHLSGGKTVTSTTLRVSFANALSELIADKRFITCGASMVANMQHITAVENNDVIFEDNERVFLGKKACRELRLAWNNYWSNENR